MRCFLFLGSVLVFISSTVAQGAAIRGRTTGPQGAGVVRGRVTLDDAAGKRRTLTVKAGAEYACHMRELKSK
jgi:hypothetical protein